MILNEVVIQTFVLYHQHTILKLNFRLNLKRKWLILEILLELFKKLKCNFVILGIIQVYFKQIKNFRD